MRPITPNLALLGFVFVLVISPVAQGELQIELSAPEQFLDLKMPDTSAVNGQQQFIRTMQRELTGLSEKYLGDDQVLKITFEQVDLAGQIMPMVGRTSQEIRVIKSLDPVRLKFTYQVMDAGGTIDKSGSEDLKHSVTEANMRGKNRNRELFLERRMMHEWFLQRIANNSP